MNVPSFNCLNGSYQCSCYTGYYLHENDEKLVLVIYSTSSLLILIMIINPPLFTDINECATNNGGCLMQVCLNTEGSYSCELTTILAMILVLIITPQTK